MKIGVFVKEIPDTETRIIIGSNNVIEDDTTKWIINPYDEFAIEEALRLKEKVGGEVVIFTVGRKRVEDSMRKALAMGVDRAVRIDTGEFKTDSYLNSKLLSNAVQEDSCDIIFCGKRALDDDASLVHSMVAEMLGWAVVFPVEKFNLIDNQSVSVEVSSDGGIKKEFNISFPAIIGCEKDLNLPRYSSLPGIIKAKKKEIKIIDGKPLLENEKRLVERVGLKEVPKSRNGRVVEGDPEKLAEELEIFIADVLDI